MKAAEVKFLHSAAGRKGGKPKGIKAGICLLGLLFASKGIQREQSPRSVPPQSCKGDAPPSLLLVPCPLGWWLRSQWWHCGVLHLSESLVPPQICPSCFTGRCTRFRCDPGLQPSCHHAVPIPRGLDLSWRTDGSLQTLPQWSKTPRKHLPEPIQAHGLGHCGAAATPLGGLARCRVAPDSHRAPAPHGFPLLAVYPNVLPTYFPYLLPQHPTSLPSQDSGTSQPHDVSCSSAPGEAETTSGGKT